jgi:hypothetical protein
MMFVAMRTLVSMRVSDSISMSMRVLIVSMVIMMVVVTMVVYMVVTMMVMAMRTFVSMGVSDSISMSMRVLIVAMVIMTVVVMEVMVVMVVMVIMTVAMVVMVIMIMLVNHNIIIWITVIRHKRTAIVVAGKLNLIDIDFVHWCKEALAVSLKNCFCLANCCSGKLCMDIRMNINMATDVVELIAVSAMLFRVVFLVVMVILVMMIVVMVFVTMMVVVIVVAMMIMFMMSDIMVHKNIVIGVSIIRHKSTSMIITDELDFIDIYIIEFSCSVITIHIDDAFSLADSCSSKLRVNVRVDKNVSTHKRQFDSMRASSSSLFLKLFITIMMFFRFMRVRSFSSLFLRLFRLKVVGRVGLSKLFLMVLIDSILTLELVFVKKERLMTVKKVLARSDHRLIKSELLAVKNKSSLRLVVIFLSQVALTE